MPTSHPKGPITNDSWASSLYEERLYFTQENKKLNKELREVRQELRLCESKNHIALHDAEVASATTMELERKVRQADIHRHELTKLKGSHTKEYKALAERDALSEEAHALEKKNRVLQAANKGMNITITDFRARLSSASKRTEHASDRAAAAMKNVKDISEVAAAAESALAATARNLVSLKAALAEAQVMPPCILTA